jgi:hypothetical protein
MIVAVSKVIESAEYLGQRQRHLLGAEEEGRHALQGNRGDDAERADGDPGRGEHVRVLLRRTAEHRTVRGDELETDHLGS